MEEGPRRSNRVAKPLREPGFVYDSNSENYLVGNSSECLNQWSMSDAVIYRTPSTVSISEGYSSVTTTVSWVNSHTVPSVVNAVSRVQQFGGASPAVFSSASQDSNSNDEEFEVTSYVNKVHGKEQHSVQDVRRNSSTRFDYLELLSVSPTDRSNNISSMPSDAESTNRSNGAAACECEGDNSCSVCGVAGGSKSANESLDILQAMNKALDKIDNLVNDMESVKQFMCDTNKFMFECNSRMTRLESGASNLDTSQDESQRENRGKKLTKKTGDRGSKVEEEKERTLRLMNDKLDALDRGVHIESDKESLAEERGEENLPRLKKKMTNKQKLECKCKVATTLEKTGSTFPVEDSATTGRSDSSGNESETGARRRRRRKVKSGSNISKRPVIKTELWPHTIANEEDTIEVTSETITLAKFLNCFSYILSNCGRAEAAGRAVLLQAVSSVLECLPWTEARAFHNMIMFKIEQGTVSWTSDFESLAAQFLDKRVRLNLRAKGTSSSGASRSYAGKGFSKGVRNSGYNSNYYNSNNYGSRYNNSGNKSSVYSVVCRQWNVGTCSYGDNCKKWHACWTCAEAGKWGESHKSTTHGGSASRGRQDESRV